MPERTYHKTIHSIMWQKTERREKERIFKNVKRAVWMQLTPDAKWPQNVLYLYQWINRQKFNKTKRLNCAYAIAITKLEFLKPVELRFQQPKWWGYRCSFATENSTIIIIWFKYSTLNLREKKPLANAIFTVFIRCATLLPVASMCDKLQQDMFPGWFLLHSLR